MFKSPPLHIFSFSCWLRLYRRFSHCIPSVIYRNPRIHGRQTWVKDHLFHFAYAFEFYFSDIFFEEKVMEMLFVLRYFTGFDAQETCHWRKEEGLEEEEKVIFIFFPYFIHSFCNSVYSWFWYKTVFLLYFTMCFVECLYSLASFNTLVFCGMQYHWIQSLCLCIFNFSREFKCCRYPHVLIEKLLLFY